MSEGSHRPAPGPVTSTPAPIRHALVDALRGFALLGIAVVNVGYIVQHANIHWIEYTSTVDRVTRWMIVMFGELKFYLLFSLLFGYGLSVQLERARRAGGGLGPRYARRMVGLLVLGIVHGVLFYPSDILVVYAFVGWLAYRLRGRSSVALIRLAVAVYVAAAVLWLLVGVIDVVAGVTLESPPSARSLEILATGSFADVVGQHLSEDPASYLFTFVVQGPAAFALVLAGVALGRTDVLSDPQAHRGRARRVLVVGGSLGLVGGALSALLEFHGGPTTALGIAVGFLLAPALSGAYVAAVLLARPRVPAIVLRALQDVGRMSLTVYLLQSVAFSTLAYGYGLGLFGEVAPLTGVLIAVGVWAGLCVLAVAWLRFARIGPVEWGLRSLSYARIQTLRRGAVER